jgi:inosine/guanosine/xanthosine phosphorylase family protein
VALVRERCGIEPTVALVLGSGLGDAVVEDLVPEFEVGFEAIPGFPASVVPGHARRLAIGEVFGVPAAVFRGRVHLYEGHGIAAATMIPRLAAGLGSRVLVLTNAAGGLRSSMRPGQLMVLRDHLNFLGVNPLAGWRFPDGTPAFVPLPSVYDPALVDLAAESARALGLDVLEGVYAALPGPSFETPAETRYLAGAGADAVGMSTVPEAVAGVALGLRVLGVSCITNVSGTSHGHREVLRAAAGAAKDLRDMLKAVLEAVPERLASAGGG